MSLLEVEELSVRYPIPRSFRQVLQGAPRRSLAACDGVNLSVDGGEIVGLVGESGCGKSTVARAVLGLAPVSGGRIAFGGTNLTHGIPDALRPQVQMVFQDASSALNPRRTIGSILRELLKVHSPAECGEDRVHELLEMVGLSARHADQLPGRLSIGERQRAAISRALATSPSLLLADEAVSALDVSVQASVLNLLRDLVDQSGISVMFISHDLSIVGAICDRVAVMYLGRVVEFGPAEQVMQQPNHPYTAALMESVPRVGGRTLGTRRLSGEPPSPIDVPGGCRFHTRCPYVDRQCEMGQPRSRTVERVTFECHHPLWADDPLTVQPTRERNRGNLLPLSPRLPTTGAGSAGDQ